LKVAKEEKETHRSDDAITLIYFTNLEMGKCKDNIAKHQ
jgi:hypothetical protein